MGSRAYSRRSTASRSARGHLRRSILEKLKRGRRGRSSGRVPQGGHHRAGLLRRAPPQGHAGRRPAGRAGSARHHQRADRRRHRLRLPAGLPDRQGRGATAARRPGLRPRRRHVRRDRDGDRRDELPALATDGDVCWAGRTGTGGSSTTWPRSSRPSTGASTRATTRRRCSGCWREAEDAKRTLSARDKVDRSASTTTGMGIRVELTREQVRGDDRRPAGPDPVHHRRLLREAGLAWTDIDRVLLVGGSTRMPMVARMLGRNSGKEPDRSRVGRRGGGPRRGALRRACCLVERRRPLAMSVRNVNSHGLGVLGIEPATGRPRNQGDHSPQHAAAR